MIDYPIQFMQFDNYITRTRISYAPNPQVLIQIIWSNLKSGKNRCLCMSARKQASSDTAPPER